MESFKLDRIYIEISNRCNLTCSFCPTLSRKPHSMGLDDFKQIVFECAPYTHQVFLHLMGEPLLHPDFENIINVCQEANVPVQLTTNGTLLAPEIENILASPIIRQINFSLQCLDDNFPELDPAELLLPILRFCRKVQKLNPTLYINLRLWNTDKNRNERELDIIDDFFQIKVNRRVEKGAIKSKKIGDHLYLHFDTRFEWPSLSDKFQGDRGRCHALQSQVGILCDGQVVPCCLDKDGLMSLGNCLETPFVEILNSSKAVKIRDGFKNGVLSEELCKHCRYISRFDKKK